MEKKIDKNSSLETKIIENKNQIKVYENGLAFMLYRIDINSFRNIKIFGENFVTKNKENCKIFIGEKEYEIIDTIYVEDFNKYEIKSNDEILEIILKGKNIEDMSYMFSDCENLIKVDLSSFDTKNVISMYSMFSGCGNLIKVNLSLLNTQNVKNMAWMFCYCENLIKIDLSSFDTKNVTDMSYMFNYCKSLSEVDLSSFNIKNVEDIINMFSDCESLIIKINHKNWVKFNKIRDDLIGVRTKLFIIEV